MTGLSYNHPPCLQPTTIQPEGESKFGVSPSSLNHHRADYHPATETVSSLAASKPAWFNPKEDKCLALNGN